MQNPGKNEVHLAAAIPSFAHFSKFGDSQYHQRLASFPAHAESRIVSRSCLSCSRASASDMTSNVGLGTMTPLEEGVGDGLLKLADGVLGMTTKQPAYGFVHGATLLTGLADGTAAINECFLFVFCFVFNVSSKN